MVLCSAALCCLLIVEREGEGREGRSLSGAEGGLSHYTEAHISVDLSIAEQQCSSGKY
jgi:hypothetical protein